MYKNCLSRAKLCAKVRPLRSQNIYESVLLGAKICKTVLFGDKILINCDEKMGWWPKYCGEPLIYTHHLHLLPDVVSCVYFCYDSYKIHPSSLILSAKLQTESEFVKVEFSVTSHFHSVGLNLFIIRNELQQLSSLLFSATPTKTKSLLDTVQRWGKRSISPEVFVLEAVNMWSLLLLRK